MHAQAVIGAGAAGLVAARELIREGHCVKVFEQVSAGSRTAAPVWFLLRAPEPVTVVPASQLHTRKSSVPQYV